MLFKMNALSNVIPTTFQRLTENNDNEKCLSVIVLKTERHNLTSNKVIAKAIILTRNASAKNWLNNCILPAPTIFLMLTSLARRLALAVVKFT